MSSERPKAHSKSGKAKARLNDEVKQKDLWESFFDDKEDEASVRRSQEKDLTRSLARKTWLAFAKAARPEAKEELRDDVSLEEPLYS